MGFRFRRSVKLIPGVRLNFSKRGASVSFGSPGATLNFSGRGARSTFGIPGTGVSWSRSFTSGSQAPSPSKEQVSQPGTPINTIEELESALSSPAASVVYRNSGRRLSDQQLEAAKQRLLDKTRRELASRQLADNEGKQKDIINAWRNTSDLPTLEEYQDASSIHPFEFEESPPAPYDENTDKTQFAGQIRSHILRSKSQPISYLAVKIGIPALSAIVTYGVATIATDHAMFRIVATIISTAAAAWLTSRTLASKWWRHVDFLVNQNFAKSWPQKSLELQRAHAQAVTDYDRRRADAEKKWLASEETRSAWAKQLVIGDIEALEEAIAETVSDLNFPFEATCDVAILEDRTVCLHVDLPEIEDVIPETRGQVLKDGRLRQVKRTSAERYSDYAHLITGLALFISNEVFVVSPTLQVVKIAAYTQRKKRGSQDEMDTYVYDLTLTRSQVLAIDFASIDPVSFVASRATQFDQKSNLELKALFRPLWTMDFEVADTRSTPVVK